MNFKFCYGYQYIPLHNSYFTFIVHGPIKLLIYFSIKPLLNYCVSQCALCHFPDFYISSYIYLYPQTFYLFYWYTDHYYRLLSEFKKLRSSFLWLNILRWRSSLFITETSTPTIIFIEFPTYLLLWFLEVLLWPSRELMKFTI